MKFNYKRDYTGKVDPARWKTVIVHPIKLLAFLLAAVMMLSALSVPAYADDAGDAYDGFTEKYDYHFRDSYFYGDASNYDPSLASLSVVLAEVSTADSDNGWSYQYRPLEQMLTDVGFVDFDVNEDYKHYPSPNTIGVAMAHKTITYQNKRYSLVAVVPRSLNYESEWANNFVIGTSGDSQGFSESAAKVQAFMQEYLNTYKDNLEGTLKIWVTGYSRGAAVANLVAGRVTLAGKIGSFRVKKENIYGYTFESPQGLNVSTVSYRKAKSCTNIHNVFSSTDIVSMAAPSDYGFIRYGTDESLIPEFRTASNEALFERALEYLDESSDRLAYNENGEKVFASETFQALEMTKDVKDLAKLGSWKKVDGIYRWVSADSDTVKAALFKKTDKSMSEFLRDVVSAIALGVGSRSVYTNLFQDLVGLFISEEEGGQYQTKVLTYAKALLEEELQAHETEILIAALTANTICLTSILKGIAERVIQTSGLDVGAYVKAPAQILALIPALVNILIADVQIDGGNDIITLIENLDILVSPHYSDQSISWILAMDPMYENSVSQESGAVTNVEVTVEKVTTVRKVLLKKYTETKYHVNIAPVSKTGVKSVAYSLTSVGSMQEGTAFDMMTKPLVLYLEIIDGNGYLTHWKYSGGTVTQIL